MNRRAFLKTAFLLSALSSLTIRPGFTRAENTSTDLPASSSTGRTDDPASQITSCRGTVAVLGAGVAGLAAARVLAQAGCDVHVFEASPTIGGFCSTLSIEGFTFDLGPHLFQPTILRKAPLRPGDVDPQFFSESIIYDGGMLRFPAELLAEGFVFDAMRTLVSGWFSSSTWQPANFEEYAMRSYGSGVTREIFKPLIEKWCSSPLKELATPYMASRMHTKVNVDNAVKFAADRLRNFIPGDRPPPPATVKGFPPAPAYSGHIGSEIIPERLESGVDNLQIHLNCPLSGIEIKCGRIINVIGGNIRVAPDYTINSIPLNVMASCVMGDEKFEGLKKLSYLHVIFVMARIARRRVTNAKWVWIPSPKTPFYRISEMKALGPQHAPPGATGLCMELSMREGDPAFEAQDAHWNAAAMNFLDRVLGIKKSEIIGLNVIRRKYAYPLFNRENTTILRPYLSAPYTLKHRRHNFNLPVENLALAGRAGTFIYLMTPEAVQSGYDAGSAAADYLGGAAAKL